MVNLLTCIFTGFIGLVVLFATKKYNGRNVLIRDVDERREKAGLPVKSYLVNLWTWISIKLSEMKMNRIVRKSR